MADFEVKSVLAVDAVIGECPTWSEEEQALYWIDIEGKTANRFDPAAGTNKVWDLPIRPGCLALRKGGSAVIAGQDGLYDLDFGSSALTKLIDAPYDSGKLRFNDGQVDRQGRLWVGTMPIEYSIDDDGNPYITPDSGAMYRYDGETLSVGIDPITIPNGIAFSPDGRTMYRAESFACVILAYDFDPDTGSASNERIFARITEEGGIPDGATVDADGAYWSTVPNLMGKNGSILRFLPDGTLDLRIEMPIPVPTMVIFGGKDMSTLYVTSGDASPLRLPAKPPMSGHIFAIETPFRGLGHAVFGDA